MAYEGEVLEEFPPGHSREQQQAEAEILLDLARELGVTFGGQPQISTSVRLDGFADGAKPICVEVWAHQGPAKGAQPHKVMRDMCKLLLVQKLLGKPCRLIFAVSDELALRFLDNSWQGRFAEVFGIERRVCKISDATRQFIRDAQRRQFR